MGHSDLHLLGASEAARMIRDEIRLVQQGVYLGKVWLGRSESIFFVLQFK